LVESSLTQPRIGRSCYFTLKCSHSSIDSREATNNLATLYRISVQQSGDEDAVPRRARLRPVQPRRSHRRSESSSRRPRPVCWSDHVEDSRAVQRIISKWIMYAVVLTFIIYFWSSSRVWQLTSVWRLL